MLVALAVEIIMYPHYGSLPAKLSESAGGAEWLESTGGGSINSNGK
jgi:hypothetical protein